MRRAQKLNWALVVVLAGAAGCEKLDTNRTVDSYGSFGEIVYREGCQRVAYTGQLAQKAAGQIQTVDVAGTLGHSVCVEGAAPPTDSPAKLTAIVGQKSLLVSTVDAILPKDFLDTLEAFLEQLLPLSDDGTMQTAIASLGDLMGQMHDDPDFGPALSRLARAQRLSPDEDRGRPGAHHRQLSEHRRLHGQDAVADPARRRRLSRVQAAPDRRVDGAVDDAAGGGAERSRSHAAPRAQLDGLDASRSGHGHRSARW